MKTQVRCRRVAAWLLGLLLLGLTSLANADPPSRVARIATMSGAVSFNPAGDEEWVQASLNRPLTTGDRLWADARSRAELQIGGAAVRLGADTDVSVLNLDDRIAQLQLTQGVLNVRVRRLAPDQSYEVDTPNLALTLRQPGAYRVEVDPDGKATTIFVREGQVEVYGEGASYVIDERQPYRFTGTDLRDYEYVSAPPFDDFDRWASDRDRYYERSASARYVSPEVIGYQDLDDYGTWRAEPDYGHVWVPTRVSVDWAPYRDGHWAWIEPWGWTWVDDAPWGFAVSHYGRWARLHDRWCWVPGPVHVRPYYAPALVAFIGGPNFQLSISTGPVGGVAWFPLGPREVYRPAYAVSRTYFQNVNVSNTVINTTVINNYYNNTNVTNVVYANQRVPGAVVAVPKQAFVQSKPVAREAVRVAPAQLVARPVAVAPAVAPIEQSVRGPAERGGKPPAKAIEREVVARAAPVPRPKFEPSRIAGTDRGQPGMEEARKRIGPAAPVQKPNVKVIAQRPEERPKAAPPPVAKGAKPPETKGDEARAREDRRAGEPRRGSEDDRKGPPARDVANAPSGAPAPQKPRAPEPRGKPEAGRGEARAPAPPAPGLPQQRARSEEPGDRGQQPERPASVTPTPRAAPTPPAQAERPGQVPKPPSARGGPDQRERANRTDPRERADRPDKADPREPPERPAQPAPRAPIALPPPQATRPAPAPQRQEPRSKPEQPERAEPRAARPLPPQAGIQPSPEPRPRAESPRPRVEAPRPLAETPRPPGEQHSPPPIASPREPARPFAEARPQPRPVPGAAPSGAERRPPNGRPNRKDERDDDKK